MRKARTARSKPFKESGTAGWPAAEDERAKLVQAFYQLAQRRLRRWRYQKCCNKERQRVKSLLPDKVQSTLIRAGETAYSLKARRARYGRKTVNYHLTISCKGQRRAASAVAQLSMQADSTRAKSGIKAAM